MAVGGPRELVRPLADRNLRLLWGSQLTSELGDWAARIALAVLVYSRTHSALATGLVTTASVLPYAVLGTVLAAIADRHPRRTVMVTADVVRAVLYGLIALPGVPTAVLLGAALVAGMATPPFEAARSAVRVELVADDRALGSVSALYAMTSQFGVALGFLCGGGLTALLGANTTLGLNAASFLLSAALISRVSGARDRSAPSATAREHLSAGARALWGDPLLRRCLLLGVVAALAGTVPESLGAVYARGLAGHAGVLLAAGPIAMIVVSPWLPTVGDQGRLVRIASGVLLAGSLVGLVGFAFGSFFPLALVGWAGAGIGFAVVIPAGPVVARRLPEEGRAAAFGLLQSAMLGGYCVAGAAGGALAGVIGVLPTCMAVSCLAVAVGGYMTVVGVEPARAPAPAEIDLAAEGAGVEIDVRELPAPEPVLVLAEGA